MKKTLKKKARKKAPANILELIAKFMGENEGLPAGFIAEEAGAGASYQSVLGYLKKLEKAGHAFCYPDPEAEAGLMLNRNAKLWRLTNEGQEHYLYNHHANIAE